MTSLSNLDGLAGSGVGLTVEERASLQVEFLRVKNAQGFDEVNFWGKIYGNDADYIICFALVSSGGRWPEKRFFYCTKGSNLPLTKLEPLPAADGGDTAIDGGFSGDAAAVVVEGTPSEDDPDVLVGAVSEANVVANCVAAIDGATAIVPRGAYVCNPTHDVVANKLFSGLTATDAGDLNNYLLFNKPSGGDVVGALDGEGMVKPEDFLAKAATSHPVGGWALQTDSQQTTVTIRSLKYPGYHFFHKAGTACFGGAYVGDGKVNGDIAFMI